MSIIANGNGVSQDTTNTAPAAYSKSNFINDGSAPQQTASAAIIDVYANPSNENYNITNANENNNNNNNNMNDDSEEEDMLYPVIRVRRPQNLTPSTERDASAPIPEKDDDSQPPSYGIASPTPAEQVPFTITAAPLPTAAATTAAAPAAPASALDAEEEMIWWRLYMQSSSHPTPGSGPRDTWTASERALLKTVSDAGLVEMHHRLQSLTAGIEFAIAKRGLAVPPPVSQQKQKQQQEHDHHQQTPPATTRTPVSGRRVSGHYGANSSATTPRSATRRRLVGSGDGRLLVPSAEPSATRASGGSPWRRSVTPRQPSLSQPRSNVDRMGSIERPKPVRVSTDGVPDTVRAPGLATTGRKIYTRSTPQPRPDWAQMQAAASLRFSGKNPGA